MPIPLPNLDDRRWTDLADDGRANITRYAPRWTDHNIHDPGITLIDLYAWLAEMTNYRLNRIPSRHKRKFLELLGFDIENPSPAAALLSLAPASGTTPFVLPAGVEFEGIDPDQNRVPFRTLRDTTVQASILKTVQVDSGSGTLVDRTDDFLDGFLLEPFGLEPRTNSALYLGFDILAANVPFALGIRLSPPGNDAAERRRILQETAEEVLVCEPVGTRIQCGPTAPPVPVTLPSHHSVAVVWEAFTTGGWVSMPAYDETRSLTLDGIVEVILPATIVASAAGAVADSLFYLRCRMTNGIYDAIPILLDVAINAISSAQAVPVTETFVLKAGLAPGGPAPAAGSLVQLEFSSTTTGTIQSLTFGTGSGPMMRVLTYKAPTALLAGELSLDIELVGIATGFPDQQLSLRYPQANFDSVHLYTHSGSTWQQWTARNDFDSSTRVAFDFVLNPETGMITFGTGDRGQTPAAGSMIVASYRSTRGAGGNVAKGVVNRLRSSPMNDLLLSGQTTAIRDQLKTIATNRAASDGGVDQEPLDHALGRAVEVLHAHERLLDLATRKKSTTFDQIDQDDVRALAPPGRIVNLLDLERIALSVPGTRVARAHAWSSLHPSYPCLVAPGVVTVVIVPEYPAEMPVPSAELLNRVWRYLDRRRLVATTLEVTGPGYVEITVTASVAIRAGVSGGSVQMRIKNALSMFLDALKGGPDGLGWPFGRSVYRGEILQLIQDVPGVDYVHSLRLQSDSGSPQCGDIPLCPAALARSGQHSIEVI